MPTFRWLPILFVSLGLLTTTGLGQEQPPDQLADRIADGSDAAIVMNDIEMVLDDVERFLKDVGLGDFRETARDYLDVDAKSGLTARSGSISYMHYESYRVVHEMRVEDREKLGLFLGLEKDHPMGEAEVFELNTDNLRAYSLGGLIGMPSDQGLLSGRRLLCFEQDDEELARKILTALPLAKKLDDTSREIINQSGISFVAQAPANDVADLADFGWFPEDYEEHLTEAEQQWLKELTDVAQSGKIGLVGLKYQQKDLQFRSRIQFGNDKTLESLVDFSTTDRDWKPDLGLESEQLVFSASIQMEAFRSSAAARVVPQILLEESGRMREFEFLQGNMLRILAELSGDSWNDLSAARVGLYQNDENESVGQMAIIGIADSRNPEDVLTELRRLSRLTSPEALSVKAAEREDELLRLVDELASEDYNIADRAETRLVLAGKAAVPALEKGAEAWNPEMRERAARILGRINTETGASERLVADPGFWTTLNPGLRLEESTGKVAEFDTHTIHVTPDPSKNKQEVQHAIGIMQELFGNEWASIQVVQVRGHFVFMIGSDNALLDRIVRHVEAGDSLLTKPFRDAGLTPIRGQIQVCLNTPRILKLANAGDWLGPNWAPATADGLCWLGLDFDPRAASVDALVPVKQVLPFIRMGMGF